MSSFKHSWFHTCFPNLKVPILKTAPLGTGSVSAAGPSSRPRCSAFEVPQVRGDLEGTETEAETMALPDDGIFFYSQRQSLRLSVHKLQIRCSKSSGPTTIRSPCSLFIEIGFQKCYCFFKPRRYILFRDRRLTSGQEKFSKSSAQGIRILFEY